MSYVNTENEAYQKLNNWQKWLVHFSQNALTRFIYQLILLADLVGLAIAIINSFNNKLISIINYNPIVLPIGLTYLLVMQFGWLFSWYAMVNHEKHRQLYFKWIYHWLFLTILLIATSIVLCFSTISFNNKLVYTSLCFFIGWFGYEMVTAFLHLKERVKVAQIVKTSKKQILNKISENIFENYDDIRENTHSEFYKYANKITINNNIDLMSHKIISTVYGFIINIVIIILPILAGASLNLSAKTIASNKIFAICAIYSILEIILIAISIHRMSSYEGDDCIIYEPKFHLIHTSKQYIIRKGKHQFYLSDTISLKTDWSDVKYRNRNQHDTKTEEISHQLHLMFNGKHAHFVYKFSLCIILCAYLVRLGFLSIKPLSVFNNQLIKLANLINFQAIGYGLGALVVIVIVVTLSYLEYAYLCRQK